jgi:hypothetical protein
VSTAENAAPVALPVDTFREAARELRRPFTAQAVKFKVQTTWPKTNVTGGLVVSYIDARLVADRLNLVCPHLWFDEYQPLDGGKLMCKLTLDGISRRDVGDGYQGKGLYSDALKRAAVKFGVGVSLYAVPQIRLNVSDGHLKAKQSSKGDTAVLTDNGTARCRELYSAWLANVGTHSFGEPLDHGDSFDAVGDVEAETPPPSVAAANAAADDDPVLTDAQQAKILTAFTEAGLGHQDVQMFLTAIGAGDVTRITRSQAFELREMLDARKSGGAA